VIGCSSPTPTTVVTYGRPDLPAEDNTTEYLQVGFPSVSVPRISVEPIGDASEAGNGPTGTADASVATPPTGATDANTDVAVVDP
jgi:hypothetical protein